VSYFSDRKITLFYVHVYHAIDHKLTTHLPRSATTNQRNPQRKNASNAHFSRRATTPEKRGNLQPKLRLLKRSLR
jgi:hypothetical protein